MSGACWWEVKKIQVLAAVGCLPTALHGRRRLWVDTQGNCAHCRPRELAEPERCHRGLGAHLACASD